MSEYKISQIWLIAGFLAIPIAAFLLVVNYRIQKSKAFWIIWATMLLNAISWIFLPLNGNNWILVTIWSLIGNATGFFATNLANIFSIQFSEVLFGPNQLGKASMFTMIAYDTSNIISASSSGLISEYFGYEIFCYVAGSAVFAGSFAAFCFKKYCILLENNEK